MDLCVNAPIVDDLDFDHVVPGRFQDVGHAVAQKVVPQMAQVKGLVGVGGAVLHHDL